MRKGTRVISYGVIDKFIASQKRLRQNNKTHPVLGENSDYNDTRNVNEQSLERDQTGIVESSTTQMTSADPNASVTVGLIEGVQSAIEIEIEGTNQEADTIGSNWIPKGKNAKSLPPNKTAAATHPT